MTKKNQKKKIEGEARGKRSPSACRNHTCQWPLIKEIGQNTKPAEVPRPLKNGN